MSLACLMSLSLLPILPPPLSPRYVLDVVLTVEVVQERKKQNVATNIFVQQYSSLQPSLLPSHVQTVVILLPNLANTGMTKSNVGDVLLCQSHVQTVVILLPNLANTGMTKSNVGDVLQPNLQPSLPVLNAAQQKPVAQKNARSALKTSARPPLSAHLVVIILMNLAQSGKTDSNVGDVIVLHVAY